MDDISQQSFDLDSISDLPISDATDSILEGVLLVNHLNLTRSDMCKSEFCRPEMDLTNQINELFPTEQSLTQLDSVIAQVEAEIAELDTDLVKVS